LASGLSILLIATTSGTFAALACAIASMVCGITPSSAAHQNHDVGRFRAARAHCGEGLVAGVSRNVTIPRGVST